MPAVEAVSSIHADLCLLGICSLHPEIGISVSDPDEAYVKRAMLRHAGQVVAVTGAEKIGTAEPYVIGSIDELTHLVTEISVPEPVLAPYQAKGITILHG